MICVSIGRGRHRHVIAEYRHLVDQGAKMVELRLDYINGDVNIKRLVADRPSPVVISCRRSIDGGKFIGSEEQRLLFLRSAIAEGVEYVDLEADVAGSIPRFGKTKRIVSYHDFRKTPDDLDEIHQRLCQLDPDIVKICTMANHPSDNLRMLALTRRSKTPMIGLCMGDIGAPTRILAGKFGAPFSYATFHHERVLAPGQLSFQQMTETYHYDRIDAETEVYGVIADPVGHSLSPLVHNVAFRHHGLNKVYIPIRVPREDLFRFIDDAPQLDIRGLSVTIPHKEAVIKKLTEADAAAAAIGSANTVVFDGKTRRGYNTDYRAAMDSLEAAFGGRDEAQRKLRGKTALVLGAGGVGKAVAYGLIRRGVNVVVADGEARQALLLAQRFDCRSVEWSARHSVSADMLFNCTPVGMHPNVDETPFEKHGLRPSSLVFDAVYNPENTLLIKEARSRNCLTVTGVEMFVRQACRQYQLFTGREGPDDLMRETIRRAIGAAKY
ncbi:MAG: type I 3-dehydroquinate dehydratase [Pirellulales bacterium]|nr:type I 3-dehydroquinate dehydratase [Pirellulales bacterium]